MAETKVIKSDEETTFIIHHEGNEFKISIPKSKGRMILNEETVDNGFSYICSEHNPADKCTKNNDPKSGIREEKSKSDFIFDVTEYLRLKDSDISDVEFMHRCLCAMFQLREAARSRVYECPKLTFGKHKRISMAAVTIIDPSYCNYVEENKRPNSSRGFIEFFDWLREHFYPGFFSDFQ
jgi:hypothetical protein